MPLLQNGDEAQTPAPKAGSFFSATPYFAPDAIFDLTKKFHADSFAEKVNLGQGTYRDENGQPLVLPCVKLAKERLASQGHEYLPILGLPEFRKLATDLVFGTPSDRIDVEKIASCQALSGTGALHLAGLFLRRFSGTSPIIYVTEPTWSNHHQVFNSTGFEVRTYQYFDPATRALAFPAVLAALEAAPEASTFVLHACAHNPSGCDPTREEWRQIADIMQRRKLFPLFDAAYLGMNSGDYVSDAFAIRHFAERGMELAVCLSFAKNMGLYAERVGCLSILSSSNEAATNITSVLEQLQRSEVSNPPAYGARIVATVLGDPTLRTQWDVDVKAMSSRISKMRGRLLEELTRLATPGDWSHVVKQSGMFCILGLSPEQVAHLQSTHHVYMAGNSRISIAGLNESNVVYFAEAMDSTVRR